MISPTLHFNQNNTQKKLLILLLPSHAFVVSYCFFSQFVVVQKQKVQQPFYSIFFLMQFNLFLLSSSLCNSCKLNQLKPPPEVEIFLQSKKTLSQTHPIIVVVIGLTCDKKRTHEGSLENIHCYFAPPPSLLTKAKSRRSSLAVTNCRQWLCCHPHVLPPSISQEPVVFLLSNHRTTTSAPAPPPPVAAAVVHSFSCCRRRERALRRFAGDRLPLLPPLHDGIPPPTHLLTPSIPFPFARWMSH